MKASAVSFLFALIFAPLFSAQPAPGRPGLLFREDWKETPAATPVTQDHVSNPDLIVSRHGPA